MAVYYVPNAEYAFLLVKHVMLNVLNSWFFRRKSTNVFDGSMTQVKIDYKGYIIRRVTPNPADSLKKMPNFPWLVGLLMALSSSQCVQCSADLTRVSESILTEAGSVDYAVIFLVAITPLVGCYGVYGQKVEGRPGPEGNFQRKPQHRL
jgi:hypothetical protein